MNRYADGGSIAREDQSGALSGSAARGRIPLPVTAYQTLEMHDIVTVTATRSAETTLRLSSNDARVPTDERNTAWKMVSLVLEEIGGGRSRHSYR
jgi:hypothetical protein